MLATLRTAVLLAVLLLLAVAVTPALAQSKSAAETAFRDWLQATVWPLAAQKGVSRETFDTAFADVKLDWSLPDLVPPGTTAKPPQVQWQAEFQSPGRYLSEDKLAPLAKGGRALTREWGKTLAAVEARYGVPKEIVVAIWGRESAFGRAAIPKAAIPTLATKAFMATRREMFLPELVAALEILEGDHIPLAEMKSSVAGALGQPQFLPSKYLAYAVDIDGDGRRDIWRSVPDTLASIANYLKAHGWKAGEAWGVEAAVPAAVTCSLEGPEQGHPLSAWTKAGVTRLDGTPPPGKAGETRFLMMPAGRLGPAFLVSQNFYVLKTYNESDLYALFVGHLADRLASDARIRGTWGTKAGFSRGDVRAMQQRLEALGYDVGGADGLVGFKTRTAIGMWQAKNGLAATCFPDAGLIKTIR
jgi:lytic murein transglycosylase